MSESDLLHRAETNTQRKRKWWLEVLTLSDTLAREFVKTHATTAKDVMTRIVVSVPDNAELAEVADILDTHRFRRVPVLHEGKLVGIISRADIVRPLAAVKVAEAVERPDSGTLQKAILEQLQQQPWVNALCLNITVKDGVVGLAGLVDSTEQRRALRVLIERVAGVRRLEDHLQLRSD